MDWDNGYNYKLTENHWTVYLERINYIERKKETKNISAGEELKKKKVLLRLGQVICKFLQHIRKKIEQFISL